MEVSKLGGQSSTYQRIYVAIQPTYSPDRAWMPSLPWILKLNHWPSLQLRILQRSLRNLSNLECPLRG
uniref:7,8K protein n=1 Tax=Garlic latent virus TaxID=12458 RepID=Q67547_9VIRU|nr:7,8K protein [Garlic latent virus]